MLDMSTAFDTVDKTILLKDLSNIIHNDELHLINIMLDIELTIRCGNKESESFKTDIGIPQGDGLSANKFTLYLSNALYKQSNKYWNELQHKNEHICINVDYADDITAVITDIKL